MVLSGAQPYYVEAFPMTEYSMYGAVPLATIKRALLALRAEGRLDRLKLLDLTNCTFDGHMYNVRRVMEECLAIKPDLIFLWDEAWSGFARFSPFLRPRTAMGAAAEIEEWLRDPASVAAYEKQHEELGDNPSDDALLAARLIPDPRQVRLRVYQTNSTHKSMSAIRQGSMLLVKDVDFHTVEAQFHEAVFTHASTSPNQQLIASLDVARRQMELEGYGLVMNAIEIALKIRRAVNEHPLISKYFRVLGADAMIPAAYRQSGFTDYLTPGSTWATVVKAMREDEFYLDPTRMTLVCGTAGFDGTQFKGLLASEYDIQLNKTSRNSVLLQSNINNTRSDVAHLVRVLVEICHGIEKRLADGGEAERSAFAARVKSLMTDVPDLPNFSHFHEVFRGDAGRTTPEGDIRTAFFGAYDPSLCEYVPLVGAECDRRLSEGPEMVSANFVIPYPPGFPIMVPGQVLTQETIDFMRKLDVKEIHGYEKARGLKLVKPDAIAAKREALSGCARGLCDVLFDQLVELAVVRSSGSLDRLSPVLHGRLDWGEENWSDDGLVRAIPGQVSRARRVSCDQHRLFDRRREAQRLQPWARHRLALCRHPDRAVRPCADFGHGEVVALPVVPVRHRLFGRAAVPAVVEARRVEASAARRGRMCNRAAHGHRHCQGAWPRSGLCCGACFGRAHREPGHGHGDRGHQRAPAAGG